MTKKGASKQNIVIIVLSVLLLLSIIFGTTYSYFNGSADNKIAGSITTATLRIELGGSDFSDSSSFSLHQGDDKVVPGHPLQNTELRIMIDSTISTYMMVTYSMEIGNEDPDDPIDTSTMEVLDLQDNVTGQNWKIYNYTCNDGKSKICTLIYMGDNGVFNPNVSHYASNKNIPDNVSVVLQAGALRVPTSWENNMQGKTISVTFSAYAVQAVAFGDQFKEAENENDLCERIAKAMIEEFALDTTTAPSV